jgi:hypothetical protein
LATNLLDVRKLPPTVLVEGVDDGVNDVTNARMLNAVIGARIILVDRLKPAHIIVRLNIPIGTRPSQPACAAAPRLLAPRPQRRGFTWQTICTLIGLPSDGTAATTKQILGSNRPKPKYLRIARATHKTRRPRGTPYERTPEDALAGGSLSTNWARF